MEKSVAEQVFNRWNPDYLAEVRRLALHEVANGLLPPQRIWSALLNVVGDSSIDVETAHITQLQYETARNALLSDGRNLGASLILTVESFTSFAAGRSSVSLVGFFTYLAKKSLVVKLRCSVEQCCADPYNGFANNSIDILGSQTRKVCRDDVEQFVAEQLPHLRVARDCLPWMIPYYMAHCSAKFMFVIDVHRARSVAIDSLMTSDTFNEFLLLHEPDQSDALVAFPVGCAVEIPEIVSIEGPGCSVDPDGNFVAATVVEVDTDGRAAESIYTVAVGVEQKILRLPRESLYVTASVDAFARSQHFYDAMTGLGPEKFANWFSLTTCISVYLHFCSLDQDSDGMLSRNEMRRYNDGCFSDLVIDRVFDVHVMGNDNSAMDYKSFLDFVVATEFPSLKASTKYFWRILDIEETHAFIRMDILRIFCDKIAIRLTDEKLMQITGDSVLSELIDMINPAEVDRVSLEDLERCGQAATVLPVMLDFRCFFNYDSREQSYAPAATTSE